MASIDVVIPNYNHAQYLRDCVESILTQDVEDLRLLIIDNASTDNSVEVANELAAKDPRIEIIARKKNLGPHASFNEGVDWAKSKYFALVCADDFLTPGSLKRALSVLEQDANIAFAIGKELLLHQNEPTPSAGLDNEQQWRVSDGTEFIADRCRKLFVGPFVVRTTVQKKAGHYRQALYFTDDFEMLLRLATFGKVAETQNPQSYRRMHGSNFCDLHKVDRARDLHEFEAAFTSFFAHEGASLPLSQRQQLSQLAKQNLVENAYWWGMRDLTKGKWTAGFRLLRFAFTRSPIFIILPPLGFLFEKTRLSNS
jgi:glycosyltransferase involved in cell wall biosynthesis